MRFIIYSMPIFAVITILASRTVNFIEQTSANAMIPPPPQAVAILKDTERRYFLRTGKQMIASKRGSQTSVIGLCNSKPKL